METGSMIVAVVSVLGALLLAWRGLRSHNMGRGGMVRMALIWGVIILGLVIVIQVTGLRIDN